MPNSALVIIGDSRSMPEVNDEMIDLIVTSPPYWHIKDYSAEGQIGFHQSLHEYLKDIFLVWDECFRMLAPGRRLCINIGNQFLRSKLYGRYRIIPLQAEFITQCEQIGFDYMGSIIWQKKTTMNTTGGAPIMGSYPYPPNGLIEIDFEYILIFKKPGKSKPVPKDIKERSVLTKDEWKQYFQGHWSFRGCRQKEHIAMFPEELPKRLIKMFSFVGETVLDPFLGSGTTAKATMDLERNSVGYEINQDYKQIIQKKLKDHQGSVQIEKRKIEPEAKIALYTPMIRDIAPVEEKLGEKKTFKVEKILSFQSIQLDDGTNVKFLGINIKKKDEVKKYLLDKIKGKEVYITYDPKRGPDLAYVHLKNRIFINTYLIKSGLAEPDDSEHKYLKKFLKIKKDNP